MRLLEEVFDCGAVDVQCGQSEHNLLRYVAGYVAKASDSLRFQKGDEGRGAPAETSRRRQVYRLLRTHTQCIQKTLINLRSFQLP